MFTMTDEEIKNFPDNFLIWIFNTIQMWPYMGEYGRACACTTAAKMENECKKINHLLAAKKFNQLYTLMSTAFYFEYNKYPS